MVDDEVRNLTLHHKVKHLLRDVDENASDYEEKKDAAQQTLLDECDIVCTTCNVRYAGYMTFWSFLIAVKRGVIKFRPGFYEMNLRYDELCNRSEFALSRFCIMIGQYKIFIFSFFEISMIFQHHPNLQTQPEFSIFRLRPDANFMFSSLNLQFQSVYNISKKNNDCECRTGANHLSTKFVDWAVTSLVLKFSKLISRFFVVVDLCLFLSKLALKLFNVI